MAEGPLVHRYAQRLREVLEGRKATIEFGVKTLALAHGVLTTTVTSVEAVGKQLRIGLGDGRIILVHLMMWGSWGIHRKGEAWERPAERARLTLRTECHEAVAFSAPIVELLKRDELARHPRWGDVGPDPLRADYSEDEVLGRLATDQERPVGEALLDQRVMAGVGNIIRIEALFAAGIDPKRPAGSLSSDEQCRLVRHAAALSRRWLLDADGGLPRMIYQRKGKPCPQCGAKITSFRQGGRITYSCPGCQK